MAAVRLCPLHLPRRQNHLGVQAVDGLQRQQAQPCNCQQQLRPVDGVTTLLQLRLLWRAVLAPGSVRLVEMLSECAASETLPPRTSSSPLLSRVPRSVQALPACSCVFSCLSLEAFPVIHLLLSQVPLGVCPKMTQLLQVPLSGQEDHVHNFRLQFSEAKSCSEFPRLVAMVLLCLFQ